METKSPRAVCSTFSNLQTAPLHPSNLICPHKGTFLFSSRTWIFPSKLTPTHRPTNPNLSLYVFKASRGSRGKEIEEGRGRGTLSDVNVFSALSLSGWVSSYGGLITRCLLFASSSSSSFFFSFSLNCLSGPLSHFVSTGRSLRRDTVCCLMLRGCDSVLCSVSSSARQPFSVDLCRRHLKVVTTAGGRCATRKLLLIEKKGGFLLVFFFLVLAWVAACLFDRKKLFFYNFQHLLYMWKQGHAAVVITQPGPQLLWLSQATIFFVMWD